MAYQVLARRWRPKSFDSLKGQWHVVRALSNAIARGQYHHAYLFTGTRGVGKTTVARILAKIYNCEQGVTSTPCGRCSACVDIDAGRFIDLLEIDAASRTRVEDTRELLENVQYAPTVGRYKIYLIDEVHMLSGHSFNALLKTLEEPPPHVIFILATTDPERIPVTVLSRCLRFNLRPLPVADIVQQLTDILNQEAIKFQPMALEKIGRLAQGSMRDALSLLEQAIAFSEEEIKTQAVEDMLGISYERYLPALLQAIVHSDVEACLRITQDLAQQGTDFEQVCSSLQTALYALSISQVVEREDAILSLMQIEPGILALKEAISPEEVQLLYQLMLIGKRDLPQAPDPKTGFEMLLLRMVVFRPQEGREPAQRQSRLPIQKMTEAPIEKPIEKVIEKPIEKPSVAMSSGELDWSSLVSQLSLSGLSAVLVKHCVVKFWDGERLELILELAHKACLSEVRQQQIQEAISQKIGRRIRLQITPGEVNVPTPSKQAEALTQARESQAVQSIRQDEMVKNILSAFEAKVENITVIDQK